MLLSANKSCLLLVDIQEKLTPHIDNHQQVIDNCGWLTQVAKTVGVPVVVTEQYPQGLGSTVQPLKALVEDDIVPHGKLVFSCVGDDVCWQAINDLQREQVVVAGIESHVCVMQTVLQLLDKGKQVYVVADAIGARQASDTQLALQRMQLAGAIIISREMALFEWARQAGTDLFKALSRNFLR